MSPWSWYWLSWFTVSVGTFAAPETVALVTGHPENTLSAQVWALEGFLPGESVWQWTAAHVLIGGGLFVALLWLACHLFLGVWR